MTSIRFCINSNYNNKVNVMSHITTFTKHGYKFYRVKQFSVYSYGNTRCSVDLVYCKNYDKVYLRFVKASNYKKDGEDKHSINFVLYTVPAAQSLLKILPIAINEAKRFKGVRLFF